MAIKVVAYDVHDTLARWPENRVRPIEVQRLLGRYGVEISYQAFEAGRQAVLFFDSVTRSIAGWMDFLALVFARMSVPVPMDLIAEAAHLYESRTRMEAFPDAIPALRTAREAGRVTCAFTTLPKFMVACGAGDVLAGLDHYFDAAATGYAKGHPRFYSRIAELLNVDPGEILCVGDDPICDVHLPREARWQAVLLNRRPARAEDAIGSVSSLGELAAHWR